ncbi:MAG TPA: hypothetical protein VLZ06_08080, partial [Solirubrobacteraceae bacterium]|nr:hypothetical protein [Solirubrobacteraceae bacterium]
GNSEGTAHVVEGEGTATARKLAVTFTNSAVFASSKSYLCTGYDETREVPILSIAYASGTQVTFEYFTGAANDTIRFQCVGQ